MPDYYSSYGVVLAVVAFGTWAVQDGRLTIGGLLAFLTLMAQCYRPGAESA